MKLTWCEKKLSDPFTCAKHILELTLVSHFIKLVTKNVCYQFKVVHVFEERV